MDSSIFAPLYKRTKKGRHPIDDSLKIIALIIKIIDNKSYESLDLALRFDVATKYALGGEYEDKPLSSRTLRHFLRQCALYQKETGIDLIHKFFSSYSNELANLIKADKSRIRLDSTMIESSIKNLSRLELIFSCNKRCLKALVKNNIQPLDSLKYYLDKDSQNRLFYYNQDDLSLKEKEEKLLAEADLIIKTYVKELKDSKDCLILKQVINEQTKSVDNKTVLKTPQELPSGAIQSPVDPEATFVNKAGKKHIGYKAIDGEVSNGKESVIILSKTDKNNKADANVFKEIIGDFNPDNKTDIITDAGFDSQENIKLAKDKQIKLKTTGLIAKTPDPIHARFKLNETQTKVEACPMDYKPKTSKFDKNTGLIFFSMNKSICDKCPLKYECIVKVNKNVKKPRTVRGITSANTIRRARTQLSEDRSLKKEDARFRNGIETVFSDLKRNYGLAKIGSQLRGLVRTGIEHTIAVIARNSKSASRYLNRMFKSYQQVPVPI